MASPAYFPAVAFGGPIVMAREVAESLVRRGHEVEVLTTSLRAIGEPPAHKWRTKTVELGGVKVHYLATPLRYRWMGITPTLPWWLATLEKPEAVHILGFRDVVSTLTAYWARVHDIPYVLEPLDMILPRYRNVPLKTAFDRVLGHPVLRGAQLVIANSAVERDELMAAGIRGVEIETRPNGFPPPAEPAPKGALRRRIGISDETPLVLNVGRLTFKKGLDLLLEAATTLDGVHVAIVGPDDGDGTAQRLETLRDELGLHDRVHFLGPTDERGPAEAFADADVFVLPSRNESFGIVAAEAAASGVPVVITDRCGVAELLDRHAALVVPCETGAIRDAIARVLAEPELRERLSRGGRDVAAAWSWDTVAMRQEELYRVAFHRNV
jgi:glycosyltransferase involved in cell wall biosynthesis